MPCRVINWQSYNSIRSSDWHAIKCSNDASVMSGQLSSSNTVSCSVEQGLEPRCRIPSSVINSQCDKLCTISEVSLVHHGNTFYNILQKHLHNTLSHEINVIINIRKQSKTSFD